MSKMFNKGFTELDNNIKLWFLRYEGEDTLPAEKDDTLPGDSGDDVKFDEKQQKKVNELLAKERRAGQLAAQKTAKQLEDTLKAKNLTEKQRGELEHQLEEVKNQFMTKEQRAAEAADKKNKEYQATLDNKTKEADTWKGRYTDSTIVRAIQDAAFSEEAFEAETLVALVKPMTRLTEELDSEGQPTGNLIPVTKFTDKDKEGKAVTVEISPQEAVAKMRKMPKYGHLFKTVQQGGTGKQNKSANGAIDWEEIAKDPVAYRAKRKELMGK